MIISLEGYPGISRNSLKDLESVAQTSTSEMFDLSVDLWEAIGEGGSHDDVNYTIYADKAMGNSLGLPVPHHRLVISHYSGEWWAVLQWGKPFSTPNFRRETVDFWIHGDQGSAPEKICWEQLCEEWGDKEDIHLQLRRRSLADSWSPFQGHTLDFKHPLLAVLRWSLDQINASSDQPKR